MLNSTRLLIKCESQQQRIYSHNSIRTMQFNNALINAIIQEPNRNWHNLEYLRINFMISLIKVLKLIIRQLYKYSKSNTRMTRLLTTNCSHSNVMIYYQPIKIVKRHICLRLKIQAQLRIAEAS